VDKNAANFDAQQNQHSLQGSVLPLVLTLYTEPVT